MFQEATVTSKRAFKALLALGPVHWVDVSSRYCSLLTLVPGYVDGLTARCLGPQVPCRVSGDLWP